MLPKLRDGLFFNTIHFMEFFIPFSHRNKITIGITDIFLEMFVIISIKTTYYGNTTIGYIIMLY
jgi:hypothetical protein